MVNIGVIGYGYWGPNIVRNFKATEKAKVSIVCDIDREALKRIHKVYSDVKTVSDPNEVLASPVIDAVAQIRKSDVFELILINEFPPPSHIYINGCAKMYL